MHRGMCSKLQAATGEKYDVYVQEPKNRLQEGETKHTISIFVGDEAGLINRVAGVFGRRGQIQISLPDHLTVA